MKTLALVLALCAALTAHAAPPSQRDIDRATMIDLFVRTTQCMVTGTSAATRRGITDRSRVTSFVILLCGKPMQDFLDRTSGWTRDEIVAFVIDMADRAYDEQRALNLL